MRLIPYRVIHVPNLLRRLAAFTARGVGRLNSGHEHGLGLASLCFALILGAEISASEPILLKTHVLGQYTGTPLAENGSVLERDQNQGWKMTIPAWPGSVRLAFDNAKVTPLDISRNYAVTHLTVQIEGQRLENLQLYLYDIHGEIGNGLKFNSKDINPSNGLWVIPLEKFYGNRLDKIVGLVLYNLGQSTLNATLRLPVTISHTGRRDTRPDQIKVLPERVTIRVDAREPLKNLETFGYGGHLDYCEGGEADDLKAPLELYRELGFNTVRMIGTNADPWDAGAQQKDIVEREWPKMLPLSFVDQVALIKKAGITQVAVIQPYNPYFKIPQDQRPSLETWLGKGLTSALYLQKQQAFSTRWHEMGNELWADNNLKGDRSHAPLKSLKTHLAWYSNQIKVQDPKAKLTVSVDGTGAVFQEVLKSLSSIDGINFSWYLWEDSYEKFRIRSELTWIEKVMDELRKKDAVAADRLVFGATEYAAHDWANQWSNVEDLGHALCTFQKAAEGMCHPRIAYVIQWTWRWFWKREDPKTGKETWRPTNRYPADDWDLIRYDGALTANAKVLRLLGRNRLDTVIKSTSNQSPQVMVFAMKNKAESQLNVFILNKDYGSKVVDLELEGFEGTTIESQCFTGQGLNDPEAEVTSMSIPVPKGGRASFRVPELCVALLQLKK